MKDTKIARKGPGRGRKPEPPRKKATPPPRQPDEEKAVEDFASGVRSYQKGDLTKARDLFKGILERYPAQKEVGDRAKTYLQACERALQTNAPRLKDLDDFYYQGVVLLNQRNLEEAVRHFEKALAIDPGSEKVLYAHAAALALSGRADASVESLRRAIAANASNRVLAASDPDLESLRGHAEFRALVLGRFSESL